ncbi:MAG: protein-L-isoaspartate(D-aspartate) O-methyltransferase [Candidatus Kariarchaeaceae archaeon]
MIFISVPNEYLDQINKRLASVTLTISNEVKAAFREIPREHFVREQDRKNAYRDTPLQILSGQTISAPHMYAMMFAKELLNPCSNMHVLEIGTGSGYGAALLGKIVSPGVVISIERHEDLVEFSRENIEKVSMRNIEILSGDGTVGIPGMKFDRIIVTATGPKLPPALLDQLKPDGIIIIPIEKNRDQWLWKITLDKTGAPRYTKSLRVVFVPLIGEHGYPK